MKKTLANPEPSTHGTFEACPPILRMSVHRVPEVAGSRQTDANDPERTCEQIHGTALHDSGKTAGEPARSGLQFPGRSAPAHGRPRCLPLGAVLPAWCDQIPTPAENQLYPYSGHSGAHRHPHDSGKLFIEGHQITGNRSCYEYHPPGPSKTVRAAVGRSVFPAESFGRTSKPAAGEREPADCHACQIKRTTHRFEVAG